MAEEAEKQKVGYKNPPLATRFQKGRSGNPLGRRKRVAPTTMLEARDVVMAELIPLTVGGKRVMMNGYEFVCRKALAKASTGDMRAIEFLSKVDKEGLRNLAPELTEADDAIIESYYARRDRAFEDDGADETDGGDHD